MQMYITHLAILCMIRLQKKDEEERKPDLRWKVYVWCYDNLPTETYRMGIIHNFISLSHVYSFLALFILINDPKIGDVLN